MGNVLLITYIWPPRGGVGLLRPASLARHLPQFGWSVTVLTAGNAPSQRTADPELVADIQAHVLEAPVRQGLGIPARTGIPDEAWAWASPGFQVGVQALAGGDFDAILSTSPPGTAHLIAARLKRKFDVPWLADLRDPWADYHHDQPGVVRKAFVRWLEARTLSQAACLTTVSPGLSDRLARSLERRVEAIPNGWEPRDLERAVTVSRPEAFTIRYLGKLHRSRQDPQDFIRGFAQFVEACDLEPDGARLEFYLIGSRPPIQEYADNAGVGDFVAVHDPVEYLQALSLAKSAHALVVFGWDPDTEIAPGVVPVKLFEALATNNPVLLANAPSGLARDLVSEHGGVPLDSVEGTASAIAQLYRRWANHGDLTTGASVALRDYERPVLAGRFASLLDRITGASTDGVAG